MMKKIMSLTMLCLLCSCIGVARKDHLFGNYYLMAVDMDEQTALCYHEPSDGDIYGIVIGPTVFAVGYDEKYIVVRQHPINSGIQPNKSITNFYILQIKKGFNWRNNNGLMGPFTLEQFEGKRKELNISESLTFTKEIKNLK